MSNEMSLRASSRGQMLLIVVLTMIVALTVGLSVVSRTITGLRISKQNEESQRAFQAAEAGIEQALQSGISSSPNVQLDNNSKYTSVVAANLTSGTDFLLNGGDAVTQDTGIDLWLSTYPDYASPISGTVQIFWNAGSNQTSCSTVAGNDTAAALEINILSGLVTSPTLAKYLHDPCSTRTSGAAAAAGGGPAGGISTFHNSVTLPPITNGLIAKIIPLYGSTIIGVISSVGLPSQGKVIDSTGRSQEAVRKIRYFSSNPQIPPELFPYSILSQ